MASSYSTNLALTLPVQGELSGTWGTAVNTGITNMVDEALGYQAYSATGGSDTITIPDGATGVARSIYIQLNGTGGGTVNVPTTKTKMYFVFNNTASAITFKVTGQTGVSIPAAAKMALVSNGTDIIVAQNYFSALTLGAALPIASGGTGTSSTTFVNAATNVTGLLPVANGGTATATPSLVQGANVTITGTWPNQTIAAAAPGTGTVTSVAGTGTVNGISLSGSVTTSGSLTLGGTLSGVNLTSQVTGTLPIANGGTNGTATPTANGVTYGTGTTIAYTAAGTTGQVLTATTSSAPTWATPSSGALVYVSQVVASGSATVSFTGLTVYDNYMIIWSKAFPTAASTILFTMLTSIDNGSSYATTSYTYGMPIIGSNSTGLSGVAAVTNSTYINLSPDNMNATAADCSISGQVTLNLKDSTKLNFQAWGQVAMYNDGGNTHFSGAFSAARKETSATNAIRFKFTSGDIASGTFRLYGIVNS